MNGKVKELLKSYNVPNNVIDIVEGYYNDMLQNVIVEYEKNNKQQQGFTLLAVILLVISAMI